MICAFCNEEIPQFDEVLDKLRVPDGLQLFESFNYSLLPVCKDCQRRFHKKVDVFSYLLSWFLLKKVFIKNKIKYIILKHKKRRVKK